MKKKLLSVLLAVMTLLSVLPTSALAAESTEPKGTVTITVCDWEKNPIPDIDIVLNVKNMSTKVGTDRTAKPVATATTDANGVATFEVEIKANGNIVLQNGSEFSTKDAVVQFDCDPAKGSNWEWNYTYDQENETYLLRNFIETGADNAEAVLVDGLNNKRYQATWYDAKPTGDWQTKGFKFGFQIYLSETVPEQNTTVYWVEGTDASTTRKIIHQNSFAPNTAKAEVIVWAEGKTSNKTGYDFTGWNYDNVPATLGKNGEVYTVYAKYQLHDYTITYDLDGGSLATGVSNPTAYTIETSDFTLNNPTKTGYTFAGWTGTGLDLATENVTIPTGSTGDREYTATWTANTYTVKFDANGGTGTMEDQSFTYDKAENLNENAFTNEGHKFTGWKLGDATYGDKAEVENLATSGEVTLTAQWDANSYNVTFHANNGTDATTTQAYTYGGSVTLNANSFSKTGYSFTGWNTKTDGTGDSYSDEQAIEKLCATGLDLYAQWEANSYNVTFNANGGTATTTSKTVTYDSTYGDLSTATRTGWSFDGWYTDATDGDKVEATDTVKITADQTLYAHWTPNEATPYKVEYYEQNIDDDDYTRVKTDNETGTTGTPATVTPTAPTGFTVNDTLSVKTGTITGDGQLVLKVYYDRKTATITFDTKGGTAVDPITGKYGADVTPPAAPTKTGYTFDGWDKTIPATMPAENMTITAKWDANTYTVTFNGNAADATVTTTSKTVTYDSTYGDLSTATRTGWSFDGWYTDATDGDKVEATDTVKITEDQTLYAHWTPNEATPYKVEYYKQNIDDDDYTLVDTDNKTGTTGTTASVTPTAPTGFNLNTGKSVLSGTIAGDGSLVLEVYYDRNTYKVTYTDGVGGTVFADEVHNNVKFGANYPAYTKESSISRSGWVFLGWQADHDDNDGTMKTHDEVFTARWEQIPYTITWDVEGTKTDKTYYYGETPDPVKDGINTDKAATDEYTYTFKGWTPEIAPVTESTTYIATYDATPNYYTLTVKYQGAFSKTPVAYVDDHVKYGTGYEVKTPELNGYEADTAVVSGTMPAHDVTVTVTYTCTHETDFFGICAEPDCDHDLNCTCHPDPTHGVRTFTIKTRNGGTWANEAGVPVKLMMNPNNGDWNAAHVVVWEGVTDENGNATVPEDVLKNVVPGANIYAIIGGTGEYVQAWTDLSYGKVRTASAEANCDVFTNDNVDYVYVKACEGVGFTASMILYVKPAAGEGAAAPVVATVNYIIADVDNFFYTEDGELRIPYLDDDELTNGVTNITMSLIKRVNGKATVVGSTAIIEGKGTIQIDASELASMPVGTVLDCDPTVGHYEWALDDYEVVRWMVVEKDSVAYSSNRNQSAVITEDSLKEGFEITFYCLLKSTEAADEPAAPAEPTYKVHFNVTTPDGLDIEGAKMILNNRVNGVVENSWESTLTDQYGHCDVVLTREQVAALAVGTVLDCDPTTGSTAEGEPVEYEWAIGDVPVVRTMPSFTGVAKGTNFNEDAKVTADSINGFELTFNCVVKMK